MDIQKIITDVVEKLQKDNTLLDKFTKEPVKVLESLLNVDLPDTQINAVIEGVKAKLKLDKLANSKEAAGLVSKVMGLFGKK